VPAPFASELPAAEQALEGSPPIVLIGDGSWRPNAGAARFFVDSVWPELAVRLPGACLHVFGQRFSIHRERVRYVERLIESRVAFARGAILAVPLFVASGVRMKILESWARGVPVVASPAAVSGLGAVHGRHLLVAPTREAFVESILSLHADPVRRATLVAGGASLLATRHSPAAVAEALGLLYERAVGRKKKSSQCSCFSASKEVRVPVASSTRQS
jgi:polysaccharide biosynthesis protein PslH